ncbi:isopeptide-forming domain-containing fimbrial protein [Nocardioides alcanivorans]|uniref:isopeptide-forming domain-containing fimbrial protein n=1 Tax=Nocardioides alcanivorans TaxID=2897352 RepID=UPI001F307E10|nr:isopeptide-forming domain-containing fimbrial protein [Nocardioides alcanivorans]
MSFLRDKEDFRVPPVPPLAISKTGDSTTVRAGTSVVFTVDVTNNGAEPVYDPVIWDVLPEGIHWADVTANPDGAGNGAGEGVDGRDALKWLLAGVTLQPGESLSDLGEQLTYTVTYPATVAAGASYTNDAGVRTYVSRDNQDNDHPHFPVDNVDPSVPEDDEDAPATHDDHTVRVPAVALDKSNVTEVIPEVDQGSGTVSNAVPGEKVTYTIEATLPANTTVYQGVLTDVLPSHLVHDGPITVEHRIGAGSWNDAVGGIVPSAPTYDLAQKRISVVLQDEAVIGADVQRIRITVRTHVDAGTSAVHGQTRTNTARFAYQDEQGGQLNDVTDTSTVTLVEPQPQVTKTANPQAPGAGQSVTYTIRASNNRKPVLHDTFLIDCVPAGLTVQSVGTPSVGTAAVVDPSSTCAAGKTEIRWDWPASTPLVNGAPATLAYTVKVDDNAGSAASFVNAVTLTGSSMPGTPPGDKTYAATTSATITVPSSTITKSVTPASAPVGDKVTFTVEANLPKDAHFYDARVVDMLPNGIDPASIGDVTVGCVESGAPCTPALPTHAESTSGQTVTWSFGHIPTSAENRTLRITYTAVVRTDEFGGQRNDAGETLTNSARFRWKSAPTDTTDRQTNPATSTVTVLEPRLTIDKTVAEANPAHGEEFTYTVTVTNPSGAAKSTAHDIDVSDAVPAGVVVTEATIDNGGVLSADGRTITWTDLGPIAPGASVELTYRARLVSGEKAAQTNTVEIDEYWSLPGKEGRDYEGPTAEATVTPLLPELSIDKQLLDAAPAYRGTPVRWQLTVTNRSGAPTAHDVDVVDTLPTGWTYDVESAMVALPGAAAAQLDPTVSGQTLTWADLADLAGGQTIVINLTATPGDSAAVGSATAHTNEARATGKDLDGGTVVTEDEDDESTRIDSADLQIDKAVTPTGAAPVAGENFSWTLTVTNKGGDPAVGPLVVEDELPTGVGFVSAIGAGWSCPTPSGQLITCTHAGPLAASDSRTITVTGLVAADVTAGTDLKNVAGVEAKTHDPEDGNNEDEETSTVTTISDFGIEKSLNGALVPGTDATYTIVVDNHGPSWSQGDITVTETLPAGLTYQSFAGDDWELDDQTGQVLTFVWDGGPVAPGTLPQITLTVSVDSSLTSTVTNGVEVEEPTDPTSGPEEPDTDEVISTPKPSADLALEKTHVGDFKAGEQGTYRFTVTNHGPSDAAGPLRLTDTLPDDLTFVADSATGGWSCGAEGQELTCELAGGLSAVTGDNQVSFEITVAIDEGLTSSVRNSARVESDTPDPHLPNNEDDDDTGIDVEADLAISKTLMTAPVVAGEQATYELRVRNNGSATSPGPIVVTDTLPAGLTLVSATGSGWVLDQEDQELTLTRAAALSSGQSAPVITVVVAVDSGVGTTGLLNIASVDGPATDPTPENNTDPEPTPVTEETELVLGKSTVGADPVRAGEDATFEITVENTGSSDARQVEVTDVLPAGLTLVSMSGTGWNCTALVCTMDRIVAGTTAESITVVATVAAGVPDGSTLTNRASVTTVTPGDDPVDNEDDAPVGVVAVADLELAKEHTGGTVVAGMPTGYRLTVTNNGPSDAVGPLTITDQLPTDFSFLSAAEPWACTPRAGRVVECVLTDGLLAGEDAPALEMQVMVAADADTGSATNTAEVDSPTTDDEPTNNIDDETVPVTRATNLVIAKTHTDVVHIGDQLAFTIDVRNEGPSTARAVVVTDLLPVGLDYENATGDDWNCAEDGGTITCALTGPLASGVDAPPITVVTTVRPAAYPWVQNVAQVVTSTPETDTEDNRDTDGFPVPPLVDLAIEKDLVGDLVVGEAGRYRLTVTNNGPTDDPGPITLSDPLPEGLSYVGGSGDGWTCSAAGAAVECVRVDGLAAGASSVVELTVRVEPSAWPTVVNTARISTPSEDRDPGNDSDDEKSEVVPTVGLSLEKSVASQKGSRVTYRLAVTNAGPSASVAPLVVTDRLPKGLALVSVEGAGWSCVDAGQLMTCTYVDALPAGKTASFKLVADIVAEPGSQIRNVGELDGNPDGNSVSGSAPTTATRRSSRWTRRRTTTRGRAACRGGPVLWAAGGGPGALGGGLVLLRRRRG